MKKIYIGLSSPRTFKIVAELIKIWINRDYSHTYIRFEHSTIPSTVYHAAKGMVHFKEYNNFIRDNIVHEEIALSVSEEQYTQILNDCIHLAGESYGYSELFKIVTKDVLNTLGIKFSSHNGPGYICSELVGKILVDRLGFKFNKPTYLLSPSDIHSALEVYTWLD